MKNYKDYMGVGDKVLGKTYARFGVSNLLTVSLALVTPMHSQPFLSTYGLGN